MSMLRLPLEYQIMLLSHIDYPDKAPCILQERTNQNKAISLVGVYSLRLKLEDDLTSIFFTLHR